MKGQGRRPGVGAEKGVSEEGRACGLTSQVDWLLFPNG